MHSLIVYNCIRHCASLQSYATTMNVVIVTQLYELYSGGSMHECSCKDVLQW